MSATLTPPSPAATSPHVERAVSFDRIPSEERIERTVRALEANGFRTLVVPDGDAARQAVLDLIPAGSEVFDSSSQTLVATGVSQALGDPARYRNLRPELARLASEGDGGTARKLGAAPDFVVGSVHAITERGQVLVASASGSQLAPYAFGAGQVIWVVGAQKIVPDLDAAFRRLQEYVFPLENERATKAYGHGSSIAKTLVFHREHRPGRITIVLVREKLGF
jgi:LUD domain